MNGRRARRLALLAGLAALVATALPAAQAPAAAGSAALPAPPGAVPDAQAMQQRVATLEREQAAARKRLQQRDQAIDALRRQLDQLAPAAARSVGGG